MKKVLMPVLVAGLAKGDQQLGSPFKVASDAERLQKHVDLVYMEHVSTPMQNTAKHRIMAVKQFVWVIKNSHPEVFESLPEDHPFRRLDVEDLENVPREDLHSELRRRLQMDMGMEGVPQFAQDCMNTHLDMTAITDIMMQVMTDPMSIQSSVCTDPIGRMLEPMVSVFTNLDFKGYMQCVIDGMMGDEPCAAGQPALETKFAFKIDMDTSELDTMKAEMEANLNPDMLKQQLAQMNIEVAPECQIDFLMDKMLNSITSMFDDMKYMTFKMSWCQLSNDGCWSTGGFNIHGAASIDDMFSNGSEMLGGEHQFNPDDYDISGSASLKIECSQDNQFVNIIAHPGDSCETPFPDAEQMPPIPKDDFDKMFNPDEFSAIPMNCEAVDDDVKVCYAMSLGAVDASLSSIGTGLCLEEVNQFVATPAYSTRVAEYVEDEANLVAALGVGNSGDGSNAAASFTAVSFAVAFLAYMMN